MVLAFFSEDFQKVSKDKTENNDMQMKHTMVSFEAHKKKNGEEGNKSRKMEQKWT